jgi:hypothetical protein
MLSFTHLLLFLLLYFIFIFILHYHLMHIYQYYDVPSNQFALIMILVYILNACPADEENNVLGCYYIIMYITWLGIVSTRNKCI